MLVNISMAFHEDILNGFLSYRATERTALYSVLGIAQVQRGITKKYIQELWFLGSAHHLMLVNISMKFHGDILSGFQVTELQSGRHCILFLAFFTNDLTRLVRKLLRHLHFILNTLTFNRPPIKLFCYIIWR